MLCIDWQIARLGLPLERPITYVGCQGRKERESGLLQDEGEPG